MKTTLGALVLILVALVSITARAADDLKDMDGMWRPTQAEVGGQPLPPALLKSITLKLDGGNYEVVVETEKGKSVDKGTVVLDAASSPKGMTITGVEGPNTGKVFPAIYEVAGDTMRVCYDLSGSKRPTEFKTTPATQLYLVSYKRTRAKD